MKKIIIISHAHDEKKFDMVNLSYHMYSFLNDSDTHGMYLPLVTPDQITHTFAYGYDFAVNINCLIYKVINVLIDSLYTLCAFDVDANGDYCD